MNKTLHDKIVTRNIKKPNLMYPILGNVWKLIAHKYNINVKYIEDPRKEKGPHILISNHASRLDYMFTGIPTLPNRYNFVAGHNEFYRSHLAFVFNLLNVIPKKNFTADLMTIRQAMKIVKSGGNICIFPEGMSSISGANQPIVNGTGKFLKLCNVPVYYSVIKGGYLSSPKYNLKDRLGHVEVVFNKLFTKEDLKELSINQIEDKINEAIYHDDYEWNLKEKHVYKHDGNIAENLHHLLYWCPKCGKEFTMTSEKNEIRCSHCGNGATLLDTYEMVPFNEECVIPSTQTKWFNLQREEVRKQINNDDFIMQEEVELGALPKEKYLKDQKTSNIVGKGIITLTNKGLTYKGTKDGEDFEFHLDPEDVPTYGMCTDLSRFYTFYKGEFYEFYPKNITTEKWFLATEEIHRRQGGKWQDFKFEK